MLLVQQGPVPPDGGRTGAGGRRAAEGEAAQAGRPGDQGKPRHPRLPQQKRRHLLRLSSPSSGSKADRPVGRTRKNGIRSTACAQITTVVAWRHSLNPSCWERRNNGRGSRVFS